MRFDMCLSSVSASVQIYAPFSQKRRKFRPNFSFPIETFQYTPTLLKVSRKKVSFPAFRPEHSCDEEGRLAADSCRISPQLLRYHTFVNREMDFLDTIPRWASPGSRSFARWDYLRCPPVNPRLIRHLAPPPGRPVLHRKLPIQQLNRRL